MHRGANHGRQEMPVSNLQHAKLLFVKVLLSVALAYSVPLSVTRDSEQLELVAAFRKVAKKAHPDNSGSKAKITEQS